MHYFSRPPVSSACPIESRAVLRRHVVRAAILLLSFLCAMSMNRQASAQTGISVSFTTVFKFSGNTGPTGNLVQDSSGNVYGFAGTYVSDGVSTFQVYRLTPTGEFSTLYQFDDASGSSPTTLILGNDGNLYGVAKSGGAGVGTVFRLSMAGEFTLLHTFAGTPDGANPNTDGANPNSLIQSSDGNFYGTTLVGGTKNSGTIFQITPAGQFTTLYSFGQGNADGSEPDGVVEGKNGVLYGATQSGGSVYSYGTVFQITPSGDYSILYRFSNGSDNAGPGSLILGSDGNFYGTAGGARSNINASFSVFKITPEGVFTFLSGVHENNLAGGPVAPLTQGSDGNFYGTTTGRKTYDFGSLFQITPAGTVTILSNFSSSNAIPILSGPFLLRNDGSFYVTASYSIGQLTILPPPTAVPTITTSALPGGAYGLPYSYQVAATQNPTGFSATGLPAGLSIDNASGLISGTPSVGAGTYNVTISATNYLGTGSATLPLTLTGDVPVITSPTAAGGTVGQPFSFEITVTNNPSGIGISPELPGGLGFGGSGLGLISGIPTQAGSFTVFISATNNVGTGSGTLNINVAAADPRLPVVIINVSDQQGMEGAPFSYQILATNTPTSYGATGLPDGLSVDTTSGVISGTPTVSGFFNVQLEAANAFGGSYGTLYIDLDGPLPAPPIITSSATASGTQAAPFNYHITASNTPTSYNATGLPPGLTVKPATGLISGKPTVAGTYSVGLTATNSAGSGTSTLTVTIAALSPVITSSLSVNAVQNVAFTYQITAANNPVSFSSNTLPAGLSFDSATGLISGTPTVTGTYLVLVAATNAAGSGSAAVNITVTAPPLVAPVITSSLSASSTQSTPFAYQVTATNNPISFNATSLPDGLSINATTGLISGTPTTAGMYSVPLTAANTAGSGTGTLVLTVAAPPLAAPVITSNLSANATQGTSFTYQITATNTPTSYSAAGLPDGMKVDSALGTISGTPTVAGMYPVQLTATNAAGSGSALLTVIVAAPPLNAPVISSGLSVSGTQNGAFSYQIVATNTPTLYSATVLPDGLSLDPAAGLISGTPTAAGTYSVQLTATNAAGSGSATLTIAVAASRPLLSPPTITSSSAVGGTQNIPFTYQIVATDSPVSYDAVGFPAGLSVDTSSGLISGTPTVTGTYSVQLAATNAAGSGSAALTITVAAPLINPPVITSALSIGVTQNSLLAYQITATNAPTAYDAIGLPAGLSVNPATGLISGAPTVAGNFPIVITAQNDAGTASAQFTLLVATALPVIDIVATVPLVTANSGDEGEFTISRTGDSSGLLIVNYSIRGTAQNGTDYIQLTGTKRIKPGASSARIRIIPAGNQNPAETAVKLILLPDASYQVGDSVKAKVKIAPGE